MFDKIYRSIFNQGVYKFLLAISIPAGIMGFWFYSVHESGVMIKENEKERGAHPMTENTTVDNYELKEINESGKTKWHLMAKQGVMKADGSADVLLDRVEMKIYDGDVMKMCITAPSGIANEKTHIVKLSSAPNQRVVAENGVNHARLDASKVELNKKNQFVATGGVNINMPGVAKVTGDTCTGALEKDSSLKNFKIIGNTHAIIGS
ncbi:MAG TPA: LPS export ABC transporter periplasmic protein LptC [Oculatellaceae cyanobacterium]